jgi:hypothetical protein
MSANETVRRHHSQENLRDGPYIAGDVQMKPTETDEMDAFMNSQTSSEKNENENENYILGVTAMSIGVFMG